MAKKIEGSRQNVVAGKLGWFLLVTRHCSKEISMDLIENLHDDQTPSRRTGN
ncbi:MAG: hypothetical protein ACLQVG_18795 [Terriglobia bacterium]